MDGHRGDAEHLLALEVGGEDAALRSRWPAGCGGPRSRTCPGGDDAPATTTPAGSNRARNCSVGRRRRTVDGRRPPPARRRRRGTPSTTISGLRSTDTTSGRPSASVATARRSTSTSALPVDRRLAPERPEQRLRARARRSSPRRRPRSIGTRRNTTSADGLGEHAADAEHHGHAELRVADQPGDQLPVARAPSAPRAAPTSPSSGRAAASSSAAARPTASASAEAEPHQPPLGLVGDGVAVELRPRPGSRARRPRPPRPRRRARLRSSATGTPWPASSAFDAASDRVRGAGTVRHGGPRQGRAGRRPAAAHVGHAARPGRSVRMCAEPLRPAASGVERVGVEEAAQERRVAEVAEQGAVPGEQQLRRRRGRGTCPRPSPGRK